MEYLPKETTFIKIKADSLARILYSMWDIQQALSSLTFLLEDCDFNKKYNYIELRRFKCYEASMVVSFARPFTLAKGYSTLSLSAIGIKLDAREKQLKEKILTVRNKIVAHSDVDMMHFRSTTFVIPEMNEMIMPNIVYDETLNFTESEFIEFEIFFRALKEYMAKFTFKLAQINPKLIEIYKKPSAVGSK